MKSEVITLGLVLFCSSLVESFPQSGPTRYLGAFQTSGASVPSHLDGQNNYALNQLSNLALPHNVGSQSYTNQGHQPNYQDSLPLVNTWHVQPQLPTLPTLPTLPNFEIPTYHSSWVQPTHQQPGYIYSHPQNEQYGSSDSYAYAHAEAGTNNYEVPSQHHQNVPFLGYNHHNYQYPVLPLPTHPQGHNVQQVVSHPDIKRILATPGDSKYLVVLPNGTVQHINNIDSIAASHPNYIVVNSRGQHVPRPNAPNAQAVSHAHTVVIQTGNHPAVATAVASAGIPPPPPPTPSAPSTTSPRPTTLAPPTTPAASSTPTTPAKPTSTTPATRPTPVPSASASAVASVSGGTAVASAGIPTPPTPGTPRPSTPTTAPPTSPTTVKPTTPTTVTPKTPVPFPPAQTTTTTTPTPVTLAVASVPGASAVAYAPGGSAVATAVTSSGSATQPTPAKPTPTIPTPTTPTTTKPTPTTTKPTPTTPKPTPTTPTTPKPPTTTPPPTTPNTPPKTVVDLGSGFILTTY